LSFDCQSSGCQGGAIERLTRRFSVIGAVHLILAAGVVLAGCSTPAATTQAPAIDERTPAGHARSIATSVANDINSKLAPVIAEVTEFAQTATSEDELDAVLASFSAIGDSLTAIADELARQTFDGVTVTFVGDTQLPVFVEFTDEDETLCVIPAQDYDDVADVQDGACTVTPALIADYLAFVSGDVEVLRAFVDTLTTSLAIPTGFAYGDNTALDLLWDRCAAGDFAACDELYRISDIGSEYETFGQTCGNTEPVDYTDWCEVTTTS
jgi:hypothetical protein